MQKDYLSANYLFEGRDKRTLRGLCANWDGLEHEAGQQRVNHLVPCCKPSCEEVKAANPF